MVTSTAIFPQSLFSKVVQFSSTSSTSVPTALISAQVNGCKIEQILISSTDTAARDLYFYVNAGSTNYQISNISIPITAGVADTVPTVSLFKATSGGSVMLPLSTDANGDPYLYLDPFTSLYAQPSPSGITASKTINILAMGGAF